MSADQTAAKPPDPLADDSREGGWKGLAVVLCLYVIAALSSLMVRAPLGHDESVYALRGRDLVDGWRNFSGSYWADYRAPGLPVLLSISNRLVGEYVTVNRGVVVLAGAAIVCLVWALAREYGSRWVGVIGALLLIASSGFMYSSTRLLADVPGAAFSLAAVLVYAVEMRRVRLRWSFVFVPLLAFVATASRFGAPFMIGAGLTAVFVVAAPQLWRSRDWIALGQSLALAIGTGLTAVLALFTHLLSTLSLTPARANSALTGSKGLTPASGFSDLVDVTSPWTTNPEPLWSTAVAVIVIVGVVASWVGAATRRMRPEIVVFGTVAGALSTVAVTASVGLVVANYLTLALPYWVLAAGAGLRWLGVLLLSALDGRAVRAARVAMCGLALLLVVWCVRDSRDSHQSQKASYAALTAVSIAAGEALGPDCIIVTSYTPQVGYYSDCLVAPFVVRAADPSLEATVAQSIDRAVMAGSGERTADGTAVLWVDRGKRQPEGVQLENPGLFGDVVVEHGVDGERRNRVVVRSVVPCVALGTPC